MQNDQINLALNALTDQLAQMIDELAGLIAVDTSYPPGAGYDAFADHLDPILTPLGFSTERVEVPEALWQSTGLYGVRTNVIARRDSVKPPHCVYFHVDTVPPGPAWTYPPFTLTRQDDRLYGRGTADMKGTIAATLGAIRALDQSQAEYAFEPLLLFCTDEEGGTYPGVRYLAEQKRITAPVLCLNGQAAPRIWAGCFGSLDMRLLFRGRSAHSGDPGTGSAVAGINAIEEALPVLAELQRLKRKIEQRTSNLPPPPHGGLDALHARLTLTMARGGERGSNLPGEFEVNLNRRYLPTENADTVIAEIRDTVGGAVARTRLLDWDYEIQGHLTPVADPRGDKLWPRWSSAMSQGFGWPLDRFQAWGSSTSSDMGWVQKAGQSEILLGGLARPDRNVHAADEHTTVEDLLGLAKSILLYFANDFCMLENTSHKTQPKPRS